MGKGRRTAKELKSATGAAAAHAGADFSSASSSVGLRQGFAPAVLPLRMSSWLTQCASDCSPRGVGRSQSSGRLAANSSNAHPPFSARANGGAALYPAGRFGAVGEFHCDAASTTTHSRLHGDCHRPESQKSIGISVAFRSRPNRVYRFGTPQQNGDVSKRSTLAGWLLRIMWPAEWPANCSLSGCEHGPADFHRSRRIEGEA